jgi:prevent-host-death family protein
MARSYQVAEAKAKLSAILRQVKQGRSVTIAERGRPIARVVPIVSEARLEDRVARLVEEGALVPARGTKMILGPGVRRPGGLRRFLASRT